MPQGEPKTGGGLMAAAQAIARSPISAVVAVAFAVICVAGVLIFWFSQGAWPGDSYTYFLAGERLNTGGRIYDLRPTDFWYAPHSVPLAGPPLVAVLWRPLAAIDGHVGVLLWWIAMAFFALWALWLLVLQRPRIAGPAVGMVSLSIGLLIGVGNVDALVLLGLVFAWRLRDRPIVGVIIGFLAALKLSPAVMLVWLVGTRRWRAFGLAFATGAAMLVVSTIGSEPLIVFRYLEILQSVTLGGWPWARYTLVIGLAIVFWLGWTGRPAMAFSVAAVVMVVGSPLTAVHTWTLLLAALAPLGAARGIEPPEAGPGEPVVIEPAAAQVE